MNQPASDARDRGGVFLLRGAYADAVAQAQLCLAAVKGPRDLPLEQDCSLELARARFQLGDLQGALDALARVKDRLGPLALYGEKLFGESLLLHGDAEGAAAHLRAAIALNPGSPTAREAQALLADALFDAGDEEAAAAQALLAMEATGQPSQVRAGLAWLRVQALASAVRELEAPLDDDDRSKARAAAVAARAFWRDFPDHPAALDEPSLENEMAAISGAPLPDPTGRDHLVRGNHLLSSGAPALATAEAVAARDLLSGEERAEASLFLARALASNGKRSEAGPPLEEASRASDPHTAAAAMLLLARDRSRKTENTEAVALLDRLAARFPTAPEAGEGEYLAARLLLDANEAADGQARLARIATHRDANGSESRWALAWISYRAQKPDAVERFAACAALAGDDETRARAVYWQARAGETAAAPALYRRALELDPLGWYGLVAQARLAEITAPATAKKKLRAASAKSSERSSKSSERSLKASSSLSRAGLQLGDPIRHLLRIGFSSEAAAELDRAVESHRGDVPALLPILAGYELAGRYDRSVPMAQNLLAGRPAPPGPPALLEAAYPHAFQDSVSAAARRTHLDPAFILAVARRESVFKPDARSAAGAVGLLQLLPVTARRAATVLGRPAPTDRDLLDPGTAVDLGAWYLAELLGRFHDPAIAVAAYNAGPRAVAPWVKSGAGEPLDLWVEEIPFKETRRYVKIVIGAWSAYRILAGLPPPKLSATVAEASAGAAF